MESLTVKEAAKILDKNRQTVERACRRLGVQKNKYGFYIIDKKVLETLRSEIKLVGKPRVNHDIR